MIDYCDTEIVAYADDFSLSFDEAYPCRYISTLSVKGDYGYGYHSYIYDLEGTEAVLTAGGTVAETFPQYVGNRIFAIVLTVYDNEMLKRSEVLETIGVCYYVVTDSTTDFGFPIYLKLTKSDLPSDINNPFNSNGGFLLDLEGDDIYWLYNLGSSLVNSSSFIGSLLNFKIGNYNLLGLLFGSGFMIYVGWVVVKWIIPT